MFETLHWRRVWDGHPIAYDLLCRAAGPVSLVGRRGRQIVGPGRKLVLIGLKGDHLIAFRCRNPWAVTPILDCVAFFAPRYPVPFELILDGMDVAEDWFAASRFTMTLHPFAPWTDETLGSFVAAGWRRVEDNRYGQIQLIYPHGAL